MNARKWSKTQECNYSALLAVLALWLAVVLPSQARDEVGVIDLTGAYVIPPRYARIIFLGRGVFLCYPFKGEREVRDDKGNIHSAAGIPEGNSADNFRFKDEQPPKRLNRDLLGNLARKFPSLPPGYDLVTYLMPDRYVATEMNRTAEPVSPNMQDRTPSSRSRGTRILKKCYGIKTQMSVKYNFKIYSTSMT